ncbi:hypothetical protein Efla_004319 [Eimeria flavescens]
MVVGEVKSCRFIVVAGASLLSLQVGVARGQEEGQVEGGANTTAHLAERTNCLTAMIAARTLAGLSDFAKPKEEEFKLPIVDKTNGVKLLRRSARAETVQPGRDAVKGDAEKEAKFSNFCGGPALQDSQAPFTQAQRDKITRVKSSSTQPTVLGVLAVAAAALVHSLM